MLRLRMALGALELRMLQRAVDGAGLPARRAAVSLRQRASSACSGWPASPAQWRRTVAGRLADRGHGGADEHRRDRPACSPAGGSWPLGRSSVVVLIVGIAVLDLGVQGLHISNQSAIYALRPRRAAA